MTPQVKFKLEEILSRKPWEVRPLLMQFMETVEVIEDTPKSYTDNQRNASWLYMTMKAKQLNEAGLEMRKVLKPTYEIPWTKDSLHDHLWIPVQKAMFGTDSMRSLKKDQVSKVYDVIERELAEKHGLDQLPFPSDEHKQRPLIEAMKLAEKADYPEYDQAPDF